MKIIVSFLLAAGIVFSSGMSLARKAEPKPSVHKDEAKIIKIIKQREEAAKSFEDYVFGEMINDNLTLITKRLISPELVDRLKDFALRPEHFGPNGILVITKKGLGEVLQMFQDVAGRFTLCAVPQSRGGNGGLAAFRLAACGGSASAASGSSLGGGKSMSSRDPGFNVFTSECGGGSGGGGGSGTGSSALAGSGMGECGSGNDGGGGGSGGGGGGGGGGLADFRNDMNSMFCDDAQHASGSMAADKQAQVSSGPGGGWTQATGSRAGRGQYYSPVVGGRGLLVLATGVYGATHPGQREAIKPQGAAMLQESTTEKLLGAENAAIGGMPTIKDNNGDTWAQGASGESYGMGSDGKPNGIMIDGEGNVYSRDEGNVTWTETGQKAPVPEQAPPPEKTPAPAPPPPPPPPEEKDEDDVGGGAAGKNPGEKDECNKDCQEVWGRIKEHMQKMNPGFGALPTIEQPMGVGMGVTNPGEMGAGRFGFSGGGMLSPCGGGNRYIEGDGSGGRGAGYGRTDPSPLDDSGGGPDPCKGWISKSQPCPFAQRSQGGKTKPTTPDPRPYTSTPSQRVRQNTTGTVQTPAAPAASGQRNAPAGSWQRKNLQTPATKAKSPWKKP